MTQIELKTLTEKNGDDDAPRYLWAVIGPEGAVHVWAQYLPPGSPTHGLHEHGVHGGIEVHRKNPGAYDDPDQPSHDRCWLIDAPCWHDGSSLYFSDYLAPELAREGPDAMEGSMIATARRWYMEHFDHDPD